ncbi:WecB/TagA/CpsF family glycosyltransferase [Wenxinia saemankumensis]
MTFRAGETEIALTAPDRAALLAGVGARLARGEGFSLVTLNLDHLVKLRRDAAFRAAYARAEFVTADGNPVVWLSRLAGRGVELVPGADLVLPLARLAARAGVPVGLLGGTEAALDAAAAHLEAQVPGLRVAARIAPPMGFDPAGAPAAALLREAESSGARLVFLALGAPKQELLAARGRDLTPGLGFACIGAGLDFLGGSQRRAPAWIRRLAMEWVWRMATDPRRLVGRYARSAAILPGHALAAWRLRRR